MGKWVAAALVALTISASAEEYSFVWVTYSQWERRTVDERMLYLAGAFDSLAQFAKNDTDKKVAVHYSRCMSNSGMSLRQFTDHVAAYAQVHPELQGATMQAVMINYLIALCGKPPG